ncbi:HAMP domain-containing histidine kinase [Babesia caballi]|uniref:HAMP domain-containing histidine kinase n=1 Tax=Babesia caballi TaxID=5871 RepID=A0AAV4LNW5_BABCB|nr:HAMP domain-containing histidine kinase [Babesia caballi]
MFWSKGSAVGMGERVEVGAAAFFFFFAFWVVEAVEVCWRGRTVMVMRRTIRVMSNITLLNFMTLLRQVEERTGEEFGILFCEKLIKERDHRGHIFERTRETGGIIRRRHNVGRFTLE